MTAAACVRKLAVFGSESVKLLAGMTVVDSLGQFYSVGTAGTSEALTSGVAEFGETGCLSDIKITEGGSQIVFYTFSDAN